MTALKRRALLSLLLMSVFSVNASAQSQDSLLRELMGKWRNAEKYTLKVALAMPEADYDFRPAPDEMTFGEQLLHIANNMNWLSAAYLFGGKPEGASNSSHLSKMAIIRTVSIAYDSALAVHLRLTGKQLDEKVAFFSGPLTRRQILLLMHDHQTHHVGQLIVYLRLKGIKPPEYVGW